MKKNVFAPFMTVALCLLLVFAFSSCSNKNAADSQTEAGGETEQAAPSSDGGSQVSQSAESKTQSSQVSQSAESKTDGSASVQSEGGDDAAAVNAQPFIQTASEELSVNASALAANDAPKTVEVAAADGKTGLTAVFTITNSWQQGGNYYYQYACTVKNNAKNAVGSWEVSKDFPAGSQLSDKWCGVYSFSGAKLTIKNEAYNGEIPAGGSTKDIGFILISPAAITEAVSTQTASGGASSAGAGAGSASNNTGASNGGSGNLPEKPGDFIPASGAAKAVKDYLTAKGNKLFDQNGQEVWLTGVNWFGYNTGTNTFDGLWSASIDELLANVADRGFNLLRIPISAELIKNWSNGFYPQANYNQATNSKFNGKNSLEIFDYVINRSSALGLKIMIDIHSAKTDAMGHMKPMWYDGDITEADYIAALAWMARRYAKDDTILAYDLKNEPHGKPEENPKAIWNGSTAANNWKYVAEKAGNAVLKEAPGALIVIEGIEIYPKDIKNNADYSSANSNDYHYNWWGGNLRGVADFPVNLGAAGNKIVYSPHDYGPSVYRQPWFYDGYNYDTLYKDV